MEKIKEVNKMVIDMASDSLKINGFNKEIFMIFSQAIDNMKDIKSIEKDKQEYSINFDKDKNISSLSMKSYSADDESIDTHFNNLKNHYNKYMAAKENSEPSSEYMNLFFDTLREIMNKMSLKIDASERLLIKNRIKEIYNSL